MHKLRIHTISGILALLLSSVLLPGQTIERLTVEDGLSQGFITDAVQTGDGFLWFATLDGLNRYDGVSFEVFRPEYGTGADIREGQMRRLLEDFRGLLWILFDSGLGFFDPCQERFCFVPETGIPNLVNICEDPRGRIWGDAPDGVLYRLSFPDGISVAGDYLDGFRIDTFALPRTTTGRVCCMAAMDSSLWIGAENGVFRVDYENGACSRIESLPLKTFRGIWRDPTDGAVWLFSGAQLCRWSGGQIRQFELDAPGRQNRPAGASNGRITCFFSEHYIYQWLHGRLQRLPWEIPEGIISACIGRAGILWVGTDARGIRKIALEHFCFDRFGAGISQNRQPVPDANGQLWLSAARAQPPDFYRYDWDNDRLGETFIPGKNANYLIRSRSGEFWFTTRFTELCRVDRPGGTPACFALPKGEYSGLLEDRRGRLLLGFNGDAMVRFDPATAAFTTFSFAGLFGKRKISGISAMAEDRAGRVWIGTPAGLALATPRSQDDAYDFRLFTTGHPKPGALSHNHVLALLPDPSDADLCWVGTLRGLNLINLRSGKYRKLSVRDGLPNDVICSILPENDRYLWLGTYYGLLEFDTRSFAWRHFTAADGLPANEFNHQAALRLPDGRLLFGGVNGFTVFEPEKTRRYNIPPPRLVLTNLLVGRHKIRAGDTTGILASALSCTKSISLAYDEGDVEVHFALLDYFRAKGINYTYRLRGLHDNWYESGTVNQATYFNLPPGEYTFEARARNANGVSGEIATLGITIRQPWWRTGRAYILYAALFLSVVITAGLVWFERRRITKRLQLEQREAERFKELEQFKSRLFSNYTHEFRTPLAIISGLAEQLRLQTKGVARNLVDGIRQQTEDMLRLTGQILNLVKLEENRLVIRPEPVDLGAWLFQLSPGFESLAAVKNIHYSCTLPSQPFWAMLDAARLRDILVNLVSNAVKYSPAGGSVSLVLEPPDDHLIRISVRDTGIGIAPEHLDKIFDRHYQVVHGNIPPSGAGIGLSYAAELARTMGGHITVNSKPGEGSVFSLILPLETVPETPAMDLPEIRRPNEPKKDAHWVGDHLTDAGWPLVLIIEDNIQIARILAGFIADHYNTVFAVNGRTGLEKALAEVPDIIICDLRMPEMDGIAFCKALRSNPQTSHIPVIILTAFTDETERIRAMRAGANAWLTKPVNPEVLRGQIDSFIRLREQLHLQILQPAQVPAPPTVPEFEKEKQFLQQMLALIAKRYNDPDFSVTELQQSLNLSKSQLHRKLLSISGKPAIWFIRKYRLDEAKKLLLTRRHLSVSEVAYRVGFSDPNYFSRAFSAEFGQSPSALRGQEE
ncbi:MAG: response regulator [Thermoanaerobaculia bacterium]|nr:response regulator [Thermoanaerobaculia bacterium]